MSRLDPSILVRRMADLDESFTSLGDLAGLVIADVSIKIETNDRCGPDKPVPLFGTMPSVSALTQAEIDAIAKSFGAPASTNRRKQPSLVQPMQQQATQSSPLQQEQAMAQNDHEPPPAKGEFGGTCGSALCTCVNARFEYVSEEAELGAFGKFFCAGCAHDKNRQATSYSSDRADYTPICVERTVAPPKPDKPAEKTPTDEDRYWNLA